MVEVFIDGASSGNPGKAGIGYLIFERKESHSLPILIKSGSKSIGIQTNNFAEYMALIFALVEVLKIGKVSCRVYSDSELLCKQIQGVYKIRNDNIYPIYVLAKHIIDLLEDFQIVHINREENKEADKLAKLAVK